MPCPLPRWVGTTCAAGLVAACASALADPGPDTARAAPISASESPPVRLESPRVATVDAAVGADAAAALDAGPAASPARRWLKGQTHVHTARSYDARTPPAEVLRFYAGRGYDFVALTDHNRVTVVEPPPGLLLVPGIEFTQNAAECDPPPAPGYRCLFHVTGLFVDPALDARHGETVALPFLPQRLAAYRGQIARVQALGGLAVLNHPLFHFAADGRLITTLVREGLPLIEIANANLDLQHPDGTADAQLRQESLWDDVLSSGARVYGLATDDAHHFADAADRRRHGKFAYEGDKAWIMVDAERSLPALREALLAGRFYGTTGVTLASVERDSRHIAVVAEGDGSALRVRFLGRDGRELLAVAGNVARYELRGDELYVRAVVERSDGARAWLQPTWPD